MEDNMQYSVVDFKNNASAPNKNKDGDVIYSQVEPKNVFPSAPPRKNPEADSDTKSKVTTQTATIKAREPSRRFRFLLVCLGIFCFLLCVSITIIICYFTMETNKQKKNLSDLEAKNEQLTLEKRDLQNRTEDLRVNMTKLKNQTEDLKMNMTKLENQNQDLRVNMTKLKNQTEDLKMNMTKLENQTQQLTAEKMFFKNQTMEMTVNMTILQNQNEQLRNNSDKLNKIQAAIISYPNFPADLFCPDGVCQTCPKDWIQFQESCYFFYNLNSPWKTWDQSRQFCQSNKSDLVVISSLEEQTFIKSKIQYYYDFWHGYWIGLQKVNNNWTWVDGSSDTLRYWNNTGSSDNFSYIIQNATLTQSWIQNRNGFLNRFICEIKALIF